MKLLICTQTVDRRDPILGFFHRWIEEFAKHCEKITVICLREGEHQLPNNVRVISLGKSTHVSNTMIYHSVSRIRYAANFLKYIFQLKKEYDAVFVHMNPEYLVLGGPFWRLWSKKIGLWYVHKSVDFKLRLAEEFTDVVFTASRESFRLPSKKVQIVGHGIDNEVFKPDPAVSRIGALLSVGRLDKSKRHDLAIHAAAMINRELRIAGDGSERNNLEALASKLEANVTFLGGITQTQLVGEYRAASVFVHTSETGSLDKVVLEALACDLPVVTTASALSDLPVTVVEAAVAPLAEAIKAAAGRSQRSSHFIQEHHSLQSLIPRIIDRLTHV